MEGKKKLRLSYSSASDIEACEQKYCYRKVLKVPIDSDSTSDWLAFKFGKAFHSIQEWSMHELGYFEDKADEYIEKAMKEHDLTGQEIACKLYACTRSSLILWAQTRLRVVKCEIEIGDDHTIGYVDFVAIDPSNMNWYIGDLKTTSMKTNISSRLLRDPQLSLYRYHLKQIADICGLDVTKFLGCLYRETVKLSIKVKTTKNKKTGEEVMEKPVDYAKRVSADSQIYVIPTEHMSDDPVAVHAMLHRRAIELHSGATPIRNYKNCMSYNRKCEYWSRCYGRIATECEDLMNGNSLFLMRDDSKTNEKGYLLSARSLAVDPEMYSVDSLFD